MKGSYLNDAFFSRLETLALELRANLAGFFGGKHLVRTYGQTVEFADYREYQLGDDIRRIDWNLYSRFEKFFLKLFTDERQMHTEIYIDCSASMGKVNPEKADYAVAVAAALGYLSVHNMDKVSYHLIKGDRAENPYGTIVGKRAFFNAISTLENMEFDNTYNTGLNTTCTYDFDGYIYCGTKSGFYYCSTSKNMLDKNLKVKEIFCISGEYCVLALEESKSFKRRYPLDSDVEYRVITNQGELHIFLKNGFEYCGVIYIEGYGERLAYQRVK